ncbi:MAG: 4-hydroxy-3-methylbut-2-enyl diphosphate reductase, partial [Tangfeifania sp.]
INDIEKIDFARPVWLYSQTTRRIEEFQEIAEAVKLRMKPGVKAEIKDTICRQVSSRVPHLQKFVRNFDLVLFVAGHKSSNGKYLFSVCKEENLNSYHISQPGELMTEWFEGVESVGICGATSTPNWLMEEVAESVDRKFNK